MTNIQFLKDRIIIDGHADTKEQCETITLLCNNLAKSKDFKTVRYESGYAEFVKVGKAEDLKFVSAPPTDVNCVIEFDSGITSVSCENGSGTVTWTTSNSSQSLTVAGELSTEITFTPIFKSGYELESVTAIVDKETIYAVTIASDKKSFSVDVEQRDFTLTITTKQTGSSGETWVFNETPQLPFSPTTQTFITNFTSNGGSYGRIDINNPAPADKEAIYYNATPVLDSGLSWIDEGYRTIILEQSATGDLLAMLTKAAVKQTAISKQQIDLSTLSGWANLASGNHNITVKAKASGYADSAASNAVSVEKAAAGYTDCLTFIGKTGDFTLKASLKTWDGTLEWSTDHNTWTTLVGREEMQSVNKKLYLRGKNTTFYDSAKYKGVQWVLSAEADCIGNIQTLLDYEIKPTSISKSYCYSSMFYGCKNLTAAPELPATTLAESCYDSMFRGCTSLTAAPELPATTLAESCYYIMFAGCTSLTVAPELPATTLAPGCYYSMFDGCTSLTVAPELPATTLAISCYAYMFDDCVNLKVNTLSGNKIFTCPSTIPNGAVNHMFRGTGGTFTGSPTAGNTYYYTV